MAGYGSGPGIILFSIYTKCFSTFYLLPRRMNPTHTPSCEKAAGLAHFSFCAMSATLFRLPSRSSTLLWLFLMSIASCCL